MKWNWRGWGEKLKNYLTGSRGRAETATYEPQPTWGTSYLGDMPAFTTQTAELMLRDHQVAFGVVIGNAPLQSAKIETKGSQEVAPFVQATWERIWARHARQIFRAKYFGWSGYEVLYELRADGHLHFKSLLDRHPLDTLPLTHRGALVGVRVKRVKATGIDDETRGQVDLYGPKALWLTYDAQYGQRFGNSLLSRAHGPWWEKVMPGGAIKLRQLRMMKDAWVGDMIRYPMGRSLTLPSGEIVSWRDVLREAVELRQSGGVMALPSDRDAEGNFLCEYQAPTPVSGATQIMEWVHDLDWDIFDGLYVPREVVEAAATGSGFSGRSIPFISFLAIRDVEFGDYVRQINDQLIRPLVGMNFGRRATRAYEIHPLPLLDTVGEQMGQMGQPNVSTAARQEARLWNARELLNAVDAAEAAVLGRAMATCRRLPGLEPGRGVDASLAELVERCQGDFARLRRKIRAMARRERQARQLASA